MLFGPELVVVLLVLTVFAVVAGGIAFAIVWRRRGRRRKIEELEARVEDLEAELGRE